jgi:uncharacterized membrane protein YgcG
VVPLLLLVQVAILLTARVSVADILRAAVRLKWLFLVLIACYVFLPGNPEANDTTYLWQPPGPIRAIALNLTGLETALMMCLQIVTIVMVSAAVRLTGSPTDLVEGLRRFHLPRLLVYSIDTTLALIGGMHRRGMRGGGGGGSGGGMGMGRRRREAAAANSTSANSKPDAAQPGPADAGESPLGAIRRMLRGDVGFFVQAIERSLARAREHVLQADASELDARLVHDVSVISGVALAMMSLKMLKVLPGLPFMPGWKTVFFYPLYILAAQLTHSRWGGTTAGSIMGMLGYLQGDGRYGALEILKHVVPGLVTDFTWPVVKRLPRSMFLYCIFGLVPAVARTSTEFLIMWLVQARWEAYLFPVLVVSTNLIAGALSGVITYFLLPAFQRMQQVSSGNDVGAISPASPSVEANHAALQAPEVNVTQAESEAAQTDALLLSNEPVLVEQVGASRHGESDGHSDRGHGHGSGGGGRGDGGGGGGGRGRGDGSGRAGLV